MKRLANVCIACCLAAALCLAVTAAQAQESTGTSGAMTVDDVTETFIGNTAVGTYKKFGAHFAQYFSLNGSSVMKARHPALGVKQFKGKHYFDDKGKFCASYPTLPGPKNVFCSFIIPLGDGRYELSGNLGFVKEVVDGKQLNRLR